MKLVIYGNSDFAELISYYFLSDSDYEIAGYCVDRVFINDSTFLDKPLIAFEEIESIFPPTQYHMFIAIGYKNMRLRKALFKKTKDKGYIHANFISSKAHVDSSNLMGENNAILHNVVLEPFAKLGNNNIINTNVTVCHHAVIEDDCFIAANSLIGGYSIIKNNCFIGFSATILHKLTLENETLIAAGTLMNQNSTAYTMYAGIPAKVISNHQKQGIQLKG